MDQLRMQAENPNARLDENNPWAKIACVIIKSKKSQCLEKLIEKCDKYKIELEEQMKSKNEELQKEIKEKEEYRLKIQKKMDRKTR